MPFPSLKSSHHPVVRSAQPDMWLEAQMVPTVGLCVLRIVHLCLRKADQKLVIIKQIPVEQMTKEERQAAQNECQVLKLLNHPNVIEYYENFLEDKALMIAMEYAPGGPDSDSLHWPGSKGLSPLRGGRHTSASCLPWNGLG